MFLLCSVLNLISSFKNVFIVWLHSHVLTDFIFQESKS